MSGERTRQFFQSFQNYVSGYIAQLVQESRRVIIYFVRLFRTFGGKLYVCMYVCMYVSLLHK